MRLRARVFVSRLLEVVRRHRRDERLTQEIQAHLDELARESVARGMAPDEARCAARRAFGNIESLRAIHRDQRGFPAIDALAGDVRFAARLLVRDRWFSAAAVLVLALGLGVITTIFTIIYGMNLRGLPIHRPDQIMIVDSLELEGRRRQMSTSYADFRDWQRATRTFAALAAYAPSTMTVGDEHRPADRLSGFFISAGTFALLGESPALGRDFTADDERPGAPPAVLLGHHLWTARYASDPAIVGRAIRINGTLVTVIGVMAEGCRFPVRADLWQPVGQFPGFTAQTRKDRTFWVVGRLNDDVSPREAQAELTAVAAALAVQHPETNRAVGARVIPFTEAYAGTATDGPPLILMIAGVLVLLVACANTANMLLGRAVHRRREMAVRAALGASRSRIVRQLLVESTMLTAIGGAGGFALASLAMPLFAAEAADLNLPYWIRFEFDARVFAFVAVMCLGAAFLAGLAPAWQLSSSRPHDALKDGTRGVAGGTQARRWIGALLVVELALTVVLLAGASLLIQSGNALYRADAIVAGRDLLTGQLGIPPAKYDTPELRRALHARVQERLDALGAIRSAAVATARPFVDSVGMHLAIEGQPQDATAAPVVQMVAVGDRYFDTLGLRLVRGRTFNAHDGEPGQDVAIVNERFASRHFPGVDPIGRRIALFEMGDSAAPRTWLTIVGVSPSIRQRPMSSAAAVAYLPLRARPERYASIVVRGAGDRAQAAAAIREQLRAVDPDLAVYNLEPLERLSQKSRWPRRMMSATLGIFAIIASLLSAAGVYAVTSYGVSRRTSEIGIRTALGARRQQILWLLLRRTLVQTVLGAMFGLAGAFAVGQLIRSLLVDTSPGDPLTLAGIVAALVLIAGAGCVIPARRAMRLDPVTALRHE